MCYLLLDKSKYFENVEFIDFKQPKTYSLSFLHKFNPPIKPFINFNIKELNLKIINYEN